MRLQVGGDSGGVVSVAPRLDPRLVAALARLDRRDQSIAETNRRLGAVARDLKVPRPSYEQVRTVIHALRRGRRDPGIGQLLLDVTFPRRAPEAVVDDFAESLRSSGAK
jgi:hypothetical protein